MYIFVYTHIHIHILGSVDPIRTAKLCRCGSDSPGLQSRAEASRKGLATDRNGLGGYMWIPIKWKFYVGNLMGKCWEASF